MQQIGSGNILIIKPYFFILKYCFHFLNCHSFGADHCWDQLYFTVIWENVEILFSVGSGDENVNYFDDKMYTFMSFYWSNETHYPSFPITKKERRKVNFHH